MPYHFVLPLSFKMQLCTYISLQFYRNIAMNDLFHLHVHVCLFIFTVSRLNFAVNVQGKVMTLIIFIFSVSWKECHVVIWIFFLVFLLKKKCSDYCRVICPTGNIFYYIHEEEEKKKNRNKIQMLL